MSPRCRSDIFDSCANLGACGGGDPHAAVSWGGKDGMASWGDYPYITGQGRCHVSFPFYNVVECND